MNILYQASEVAGTLHHCMTNVIKVKKAASEIEAALFNLEGVTPVRETLIGLRLYFKLLKK